MIDERFKKLKVALKNEQKIVTEIENLMIVLKTTKDEESSMITSQIKTLNIKLKNAHELLKVALSEILFSKPLEITKNKLKDSHEPEIPKKFEKELNKSKSTSESEYSKFASLMFSKYSRELLSGTSFKKMGEQLVHANLDLTPVGYTSMVILTTFISFFAAIFIFGFFLFFNIDAIHFITRATGDIGVRFLSTFWILFVIPIGTFVFMYFYPGMEKSSAEDAIDVELPFATIHMSAISGSMINPIKIFEIIASTGEYPALEKEFTKMINEINLYGYDVVSALKHASINSPSKKLGELFTGLATIINSGGDIVKFFEKRAQTFLFDYKIAQKQASRTAESTMDIYISMLIAAPMILMLLLMIMKISGMGISMSISTIGLLVTLGVVVVNAIFMAYLHTKKSK